MSSIPTTIPSAKPGFDENRWVTQIRRTLQEELEEDSNIPVSIFNVPKSLMASDPDSYIPQQIALGPYHYFRPELYEMEKYKLAAARKIQSNLETRQFEELVEKLKIIEPRIRGCYHRYLTFNGETLAWMMAIDACFVLEFLQLYAIKTERETSRSVSHLADGTGRKSAHNAILRDLAMLENQIPMFILRKMLKIQSPSSDLGDNLLFSMLVGFGRELSPFKVMNEETLPNIQVKDRAHILDFMYHMIVPQCEELQEIIEIEDEQKNEDEDREKDGKISFAESSHVKQFFEVIYKILSKVLRAPISLLKTLLSKPLKLLVKLPWSIISHIPILKMFKQPIESLFSSGQDKDDEKPAEKENNQSKAPLAEEISIPSVTQLYRSGVCFAPIVNGGIMDITFNEKTVTLSLPVVSLDVNSEVILRNLVAYEACTGSRPLVFTRYTELMNGIIDTEEDAKFLREKGIIINRMKSDKEVASVWNGMSKCVRLTKVDFLDKTIEGVNKYYNSRWRVKAGKFIKEYIFGSWPFLTLLAAVAMLCLTALQAFCSVYSCRRIFRIEGLEAQGSTN